MTDPDHDDWFGTMVIFPCWIQPPPHGNRKLDQAKQARAILYFDHLELYPLGRLGVSLMYEKMTLHAEEWV